MIFEYRDYRSLLRDLLGGVLPNKKKSSLRSFSEKIGVSNAFLSEVLASKKSISIELALRIAYKLKLTDLETQFFCLLVQIESEKDEDFKSELTRRLNAISTGEKEAILDLDILLQISNWYYWAILELTDLTGFTFDEINIIRALKITPEQTSDALSRLLRMGLLKQDKSGIYKKAKPRMFAESKVANAGLKMCHRQILKLASESFDKFAPIERINATDFVAIDSNSLPEIDRLSREFSTAVQVISEKAKVKDAVYTLAVHFFKLN